MPARIIRFAGDQKRRMGCRWFEHDLAWRVMDYAHGLINSHVFLLLKYWCVLYYSEFVRAEFCRSQDRDTLFHSVRAFDAVDEKKSREHVGVFVDRACGHIGDLGTAQVAEGRAGEQIADIEQIEKRRI